VSLDTRRRQREDNGRSELAGFVASDVFRFSKERYDNARAFFAREDVEREMVDILLRHLPFNLREMLREKPVLLVPGKSVERAYGHLVERLGYKRVLFIDVLRDKGVVLKRDGVSPLMLSKPASDGEILLRAEATERSSAIISAGATIAPAEAGAQVAKERSFQASSTGVITKEDLPLMLELLLREVDRQGGLINRRPHMMVLTPYDLKMFGEIVVGVLPFLDNLKAAITFPSRDAADAFYQALARGAVLSPFFTRATPAQAADMASAIRMALVDGRVKGKMPEGLRELVELLDRRGLLEAQVKLILKHAGFNPFLALKVTTVFLSKMYGHMNRRAGRLESALNELRKNGHGEMADRLERVLEVLVKRNTGIAFLHVVGHSKNTGALLPPEGDTYMGQLEDFILGLSMDKAWRLYQVLETRNGVDREAVNVLLNIGAVYYQGSSLALTYIGDEVRGMLRRRLDASRLSGLFTKLKSTGQTAMNASRESTSTAR